MNRRLVDLIERHVAEGHHVSPSLVLDLIRQHKFTGEVLFRFRDGRAMQVEPGRPVAIPLSLDPVVDVQPDPVDNLNRSSAH